MPRLSVVLGRGKALGAACVLAGLCSLALGQSSGESASHHKTSSKKATASAAHKTSSPPSHSAGASHTKSHTSFTSATHKGKKLSASHKGQQKIDSERAFQIQQALVREHYLNGAPTGKWDPATEEAMRRYQADNGWQSKTVPDSRALIKLGLGPNHDHLLNPESAMTSAPQSPRGSAAPPAGGSDPAEPSARPQQ